MDSLTQVYLIGISYIYGVFFYLLAKYNMLITKNLSPFLKYIITFIFVIDIVIIYIYIVFKINKGIFHIYFLLSMFLGYITILKILPNVVKFCQLRKKKKKF